MLALSLVEWELIYMILFLITLAIVASKPLNPKKVIYAINCGAPSNYKSPSGIPYEKVTSYQI